MRFVLDASVALAWFLPEEKPADRAYAYDVLYSMRAGSAFAVVPLLWHEEVAHVLLRERRGKRIGAFEFDAVRQMLGDLALETHMDAYAVPILLERALRYHLQGFDAVYFDLAKAAKLPIAALDRGIRAACRVHGVALFKP